MNLQYFVSKVIKHAMLEYGLPDKYDPQVFKSSNKFRNYDYQVNGIMNIAKKLNVSAQILSQSIVQHINKKNIFKRIEISNPGFINLSFNNQWISNKINEINTNFVSIESHPKKIIIDYSSPNMSKEMHVGHLRSTIIGDSIARILKYLGHKVIQVNHIGDWGIQFGMLIAMLKNDKKIKITLSNLHNLYQNAKIKYEKDLKFAKLSNYYLYKLQLGDKSCLNIWKKIISVTIKKNQRIYNLLNVSLKEKHITGESFYKDMLYEIVNDLQLKKIAVFHKGSIVVFLKNFKNRMGDDMGVIIKKNNGGYLYSTIDLACIKYRCQKLKANRILYFVDSRQRQHLLQVFYIAQQAGYMNNAVCEHHNFGMILGKDHKPFKTRYGNSVKLYDLIKESIIRAKTLIKNKNSNIKKKDLYSLSKIIGIGAVKYFDLSKNKNTDYVFNWNNMLNFEGNTSPYIQYSYTRIISILKKSKVTEDQLNNFNFIVTHRLERKIAIHLLRFEELLLNISKVCMPHLLCNYLYDLSSIFSNFYENYCILSLDEKIRFSRLKISFLTSKVLKLGLNMLGIKTTEIM